MPPQLMVQPSSLMASGVQMREFGGVYLFRFSDELQSRFEALLNRQKSTVLTDEEQAEYAGITELQRIFTLINAQLAAQSQWCPVQPDSRLGNELNSSVNTAIPPNT